MSFGHFLGHILTHVQNGNCEYRRLPLQLSKVSKEYEVLGKNFLAFRTENPLKDAFHEMQLSMMKTTVLYFETVNECHFSNVDAAIHNK
jgi:hypothetical protein